MKGGCWMAVLPLLLAGCVKPVPVAEVQPVCRNQDVVAFMDAELARRRLYATLLPLTVSERSIPGSPETQCGAYARQVVFDTTVPGAAPAAVLVPVSYSVRPVENGFVVTPGAPQALRGRR